jgi:MHS family proline/betaine transporter-like MFS transporter
LEKASIAVPQFHHEPDRTRYHVLAQDGHVDHDQKENERIRGDGGLEIVERSRQETASVERGDGQEVEDVDERDAGLGERAPGALHDPGRIGVMGFSAGGELGSSTAFIVEWAPPQRRGLFGSLQQASVAGGFLLGSLTAASLSTWLSPAALEAWGWRVPFLFDGLLGPIGLYMRRNIEETPPFKAAVQERAERGIASVAHGWRLAARAFGFTVLWTIAYYIFLSYMPTFLQKHAGLDRTQALWSNTLALLVLVAAVPTAGALSDRIGRKPLLLASCAAFLLLPYPLFATLLSNPSLPAAIAVQVLFALAIALFSGPGPAAIAEIFPTRMRSTWMSIGYSLAAALFGGFAPFVATWLIARTGSPLAPTWYVIGAAVVSAITIATQKETAHEALG